MQNEALSYPYQRAVDEAAALIAALTMDALAPIGTEGASDRENLKRQLKEVNRAVKVVIETCP